MDCSPGIADQLLVLLTVEWSITYSFGVEKQGIDCVKSLKNTAENFNGRFVPRHSVLASSSGTTQNFFTAKSLR
jgi:hypothetical protein